MHSDQVLIFLVPCSRAFEGSRQRGDFFSLFLFFFFLVQLLHLFKMPPFDHKVTSLTVRPLCHMEKYSQSPKCKYLSVSFCSGQD